MWRGVELMTRDPIEQLLTGSEEACASSRALAFAAFSAANFSFSAFLAAFLSSFLEGPGATPAKGLEKKKETDRIALSVQHPTSATTHGCCWVSGCSDMLIASMDDLVFCDSRHPCDSGKCRSYTEMSPYLPSLQRFVNTRFVRRYPCITDIDHWVYLSVDLVSSSLRHHLIWI
jgi:hypothetical protein